MTPSSPTALTRAQTSALRKLKQAKYRRLDGLFLLEGRRLCEEAFASDLAIETCLIETHFDQPVLPPGINMQTASATQIQQIADSKSPQGIICVARIPAEQPVPAPVTGKVVLALDRLADPGNMGTIFRSALWFGITDIVLGTGCVDPYSPKVVRSSMGAIAHLQLHTGKDLMALAESWQNTGGELAALHMQGRKLADFETERGLLLIVGSEAHGVASPLLALATPLAIPQSGRGESLNAAMATGIALYEFNRKVSS